jgi:hypothetical protein
MCGSLIPTQTLCVRTNEELCSPQFTLRNSRVLSLLVEGAILATTYALLRYSITRRHRVLPKHCSDGSNLRRCLPGGIMNNIRKGSRGSHTSNMSPPLFINQSHPLPINSSASSIIPKLGCQTCIKQSIASCCVRWRDIALLAVQPARCVADGTSLAAPTDFAAGIGGAGFVATWRHRGVSLGRYSTTVSWYGI